MTGGKGTIRFTVSDDLGNPLVAKSKIIVTVKGPDTLLNDLYLSNASVELQDFNTPGPGTTQFSVGVTDKGMGKSSGNVTFGIEIVSENGNYKNEDWLTGYIGQGSTSFNIPASIEVTDSSVRSLYLAETGITNEISKTVTFIVKDANGNPISQQIPINFSLSGFPTDVTLSRYSDTTTLAGKVSVKISSGNTRGSGTIDASTSSGQIIRGSSLPIDISRGLPIPGKIRVELDRGNLFNTLGKAAGTVTLTLLDKDGYYAAPQSNITASTSAGDVGIIPQTVNGRTSFTLYGGPDRGTPAGFRTGFGLVRTFVPVSVANGSIYEASVAFLFSYAPQITITSPSLDTLADGSSVDVMFDIKDLNDNPISSQNKLTVSLKGDVAADINLSGDIDKQTFDDDTSFNSTHYKFTLTDKIVGGGKPGKFTVTILVTGESGTATKSFDVYLLPAVATEKISFVSATNMTLGVLGSGSASIQTSQITFRVTDRNGQKIDENNSVYVDFSLSSTAGGTDINPKRVKTDANGDATTTLYAGSQYGTFQVTASFIPTNKTIPISSQPVTFTISGPSKNNFTISLSKKNIPGVGAPTTLPVGSITALAQDSVNVPVLDGTMVSLRTTGGTVERQIATSNGAAIAKISGGAIPTTPALGGKGFGYIYASVAGDLGTTVTDSLPFMFSGPPTVIQFTDAVGNPSVPLSTPILDGGSATVYFKVRDVNWLPVSNDYIITVAVEGDTGALQIKNISMIRDVQSMSDTTQICKFDLQDLIKNGGPSGPIAVTITVAATDLGSYSTIIPGTLASAVGKVGTRVQTLQFVSSSTAPIYVRGTGLPEFTTLVFALIDSNGQAVSLSKADTVLFSISSNSGIGLEQLSTTAMLSNVNSQVMTSFYAGTRSGTFTVVAQVKDLPMIQATKDITVIGGFPNQNKFTMQWAASDTLLNVPGFVVSGTLASASILALDQYSNPAKPSVIQFDGTTGGSAPFVTTDATGRANATLSGGKPYPGLTPGYGYVGYLKAYTLGDNGLYIRDSLKYLYTGAPKVTVDTSSGMTLTDGGTLNIGFTISDEYNQALAGGNNITLTLEGSASSSISSQTNAPGTTPSNKVTPASYYITLTDNTPQGGVSGSFSVKISVSGVSGSTTKIITGTLLPGVSGYASSIELLSGSPSVKTISVKGTGATETATMSFVVKDSLGNPVSSSRQATVTFSIVGGPGGGEFVSPTSAVTDANGKVTTTVNSGTKAGVMQVVANIGAIQSAPVSITVASGLADLIHFTVWTDKPNWPWNAQGLEVGTVFVQMGDMYGNPVQSNTALYFTTTGGIITSSAFTDATGHASATVFGGNPYPYLGLDTITVTTIGQGGVTITKKVTNVFSGTPTVIVASTNLGTIGVGSSMQVDYKVADANDNPLAASNTISVVSGGTAGSLALLSGNTSVTITDTTRYYQFTVANNVPQGGTGGSFTVAITVNGPNGTTTKTLTGTLATPPAVVSGFAASIKLVSASSSTVSVKGTGASESALLTFVVNDSTGKAIDISHQISVTFAITNGPGGGANLNPTSALTDASGQVSTTLNAGTISGPIAITASIASPAASASVTLTIAGGLPDQNHFTVWTDKLNYPGLLPQGGVVGVIKVQAGDVYGNPVQPSAVYLRTTGGAIDATITTNASGAGQANIYGGNPNPIGGKDTITVTTTGFGGASVSQQTVVLFTGSPKITVSAFPQDTLSPLADGGFLLFGFDLKDINNNPIASGNSLAAYVTGDQSVTSQIAVSINGSGSTIPLSDTQDTSSVHYQIKISDMASGSGSGGYFALTLTSSGLNGTYSKSLVGFLQAPGVVVGSGGGTGYTSSILLKSVSSTDISVAGTGSSETATLVFQAADSLGQSVDAAHASMMHFSISPPTLGSVLTIDSITTDASGRATTLVRSGTVSGVIQVKASVTVNGRTINSLPVRISINSGLPDQAHFTIGAERYNFPGLRFNGLTNGITVQMGDQYSNPVQTGTVAYFNSLHGIIQTTGSTTSSDGFITKNLFSANPRPENADTLSSGPGWSYVYSTTAGPNGTTVKDSVKILWTGPPIIAKVSGPASFNIVKGGSDGTWVFTVMDLYNHPMSAGTNIIVSAAGGSVAGDANVTLPDTQSGFTTFSVDLYNSSAAGSTDPPVASSLIVTVSHPVYGTYSYTLASGVMQ